MAEPSRTPAAWLALAALSGASAIALLWRRNAARDRREFARLHRALVDLLLNTLSAGDAATERHSRRVADLTDVLARAFGLTSHRHSTLRIAALLHDMGKIDDRFFDILHGCGPLSDEQRDAINHHPHEGAEILEPIEAIHPGLTRIVAAHHEYWDGTGYPEGLAREEIPFEARLISVADVFDAMTQPRTYREARDPEDAIQAIRANASTRFDPHVVAQLQRPDVLGEWLSIRERGRREEESVAEESEEI